MRKRIFLMAVVCLASSSLSSQAWAFGPFEMKVERMAKMRAQDSTVPGVSCTDFSGKWQGQCTVNGKTSDDSVEIQQFGCTAVIVDHEYFSFGSIRTETNSNSQYGSTEIMAVDWSNADKTQLKINGSVTSASFTSKNGLQQLSGNTVVEVVGGKLLARSVLSEGVISSCTYDKR